MAPVPLLADHRACAVLREQFQQHRVGDPPVNDRAGPHTTANGVQGGFGLGDHAAGDGAVGDHRVDICGGEFSHHVAGLVLDARDIGEQQQSVRFKGDRDGPGCGIAVDVVGLAVLALAERGNDGDHVILKEVVDHARVDLGRLAHKAEFGVGGRASDQVGVLARKAHGLAAFGINGLHDPLVHETGEDHLDHFNGGGIGNALAVLESALDPEFGQHIVDHRAAAVDHHGVHANLPQQDDVARERGHFGVVPHRVPAEFHHDDGVVEALQVGQRFGERACGGEVVADHLGFHAL
mmetsp:Transcript_1091/g.2157  ORF Transcript_1091/g.2157 Transcript_1091/m.2157 type:complete len:294 (+) Transcript_1091:76-957(+)